MESGWHAGARVRVVGLTKAAQHNGKVGSISASKAAKEGRIGVVLCDGLVLAVRKDNLELVDAGTAAASDNLAQKGAPHHKQRTLTRDTSLLQEFDGSRDPDLLVLYFHLNDRAFDCFNAPEYNDQMHRYLSAGMSVVAVVPRRIRENEYLLVCLRHTEDERNSLCELAFNCMRQFAGISMLVKKRCFACGNPNAPLCACLCACFCPDCSRSDAAATHRKTTCSQIQSSLPEMASEDESIQLII